MRNIIIKSILSDKVMLSMLSAFVILSIFTLALFIHTGEIKKKNTLLKAGLKEMNLLKDELSHVKRIVESQEKKIGLTKSAGAVSALEQTLESLGLKAKTIRPLEKKKIEELYEEDTELIIEGIDLNKIVNLLYKIENSPMPMKIKNAHLKTTFESPDMFILNMTVSLISK